MIAFGCRRLNAIHTSELHHYEYPDHHFTFRCNDCHYDMKIIVNLRKENRQYKKTIYCNVLMCEFDNFIEMNTRSLSNLIKFLFSFTADLAGAWGGVLVIINGKLILFKCV